jgi:hypothetical protein
MVANAVRLRLIFSNEIRYERNRFGGSPAVASIPQLVKREGVGSLFPKGRNCTQKDRMTVLRTVRSDDAEAASSGLFRSFLRYCRGALTFAN